MFNINRFPYTSFTNVNLDWIMKTLKSVVNRLNALDPNNVSGIVAVENGGTGADNPTSARLNLGLGNISIENAPLPVNKGGTGHDNAADVLDEFKIVSYDAQTLDPADAAQARSNLGIGNLAVEDAPLSIDKGGTGSSDKATAAGNLEVVSWGASQTLNGTQKTRARTNIGIDDPIYTEISVGTEDFEIAANANSCDISISNVPDGYTFICLIGGASIGFICAPYFTAMDTENTKAWVNVAPASDKNIRVYYLYGKRM